MQPDKIFSREKLLENVWGYEYYGDVRTVDVTVRRLREKSKMIRVCLNTLSQNVA